MLSIATWQCGHFESSLQRLGDNVAERLSYFATIKVELVLLRDLVQLQCIATSSVVINAPRWSTVVSQLIPVNDPNGFIFPLIGGPYSLLNAPNLIIKPTWS